MSIKDPVESRRQSLEEIAASWDLEGALPDAETLEIARRYADGAFEIEEAIERIRTSTLSRCASQQA
ncbi:antitoxin VbhA family protein [Acidipropionibacterium jensenii]|uniref:antitoxin VbhA family protein n=1 Tax=Acidipropionibacterium jensenii TaxID=1749 RepID=UPI00214A8BCA